MKKTNVAVIGLGFVGLPTAIALAKTGMKVFGIDISKERVKKINLGKSYISEIPDKELKESLKNFSATTDWSVTKKSDVIPPIS